MNEINCALVPAADRRRRSVRPRPVPARVMALAFGTGLLLGLIWARSMDKPEGGMVPRVSITYEAVSYDPEEHR